MNVNPGELNKKIEIIEKTVTTDADGFDVETEKVVRTCYASFKRTSGTEAVKANADFGEIKARFLVRYTSTPLNRKMRIRYNDEVYNISYINNYNDSNEYIEIWCDLKEV